MAPPSSNLLKGKVTPQLKSTRCTNWSIRVKTSGDVQEINGTQSGWPTQGRWLISNQGRKNTATLFYKYQLFDVIRVWLHTQEHFLQIPIRSCCNLTFFFLVNLKSTTSPFQLSMLQPRPSFEPTPIRLSLTPGPTRKFYLKGLQTLINSNSSPRK